MSDKKEEVLDPYNNPMIESAKNALTPEQREEYKRIGEYMYNNDIYNISETRMTSKNASDQDLCLYASEFLKAGGDPKDLSDNELRALEKFYGGKWYERFDISLDAVVQPILQFAQKKQQLSRQERRKLERILEKKEKKNKN